MRVAVLGAGVIGITTAYFLKKNGHDVVVIDRNSGTAQECSFMNAAQLSYCNAQPWANKAALIKGLKWLGRKDAPLRFRFRLADFQMWAWLVRFVLNCNKRSEDENTRHILNLCLYSRAVLHQYENEFDFDFDFQKTGKIFVYEDQDSFDSGLKQARLQEVLGAPYQKLSFDDLLQHEPNISHLRGVIVGAVRDQIDDTGDAYKFCVGLENKLKEMGVEFRYNTTIENLERDGSKIKSVVTDQGNIQADAFIYSLGAYSPIIAKKLGIKLPIYPLKGYSITVPITNEAKAPITSITYQNARAVFSRIGNRMRVSGTAEFAGYDHSIDKERIAMLKNLTRKVFPDAGNIDAAEEWACLRPATPDFRPIIGNSIYENMVLNTGQGALGWTMAFASAKMATDLIEGKQPEIDVKPFALERFKTL